jgi:hypothetical protein
LLKTLSPDSGVSLPIPQNKITYATPKPHENSSEQFIWGIFQKNTENLCYQKPLYKKNQGFQNQLDKKPSLWAFNNKEQMISEAHPQIPQKLQPIKETLIMHFQAFHQTPRSIPTIPAFLYSSGNHTHKPLIHAILSISSEIRLQGGFPQSQHLCTPVATTHTHTFYTCTHLIVPCINLDTFELKFPATAKSKKGGGRIHQPAET